MNPTTIQILLSILGLALLCGSAEALVRGSSKLALAWGVPPLIIGLTIVAFGTSAPELIVAIQASLMNQGQIVIGNVVGSNLANLGFILGLTALLCPLTVETSILKKEMPILATLTIGCSAALLWTGIPLLGGAILLAIVAIYTLRINRGTLLDDPLLKIEVENVAGEKSKRKHPIAFNLILTIGGLIGLTYGGSLLVTNAVSLANTFNVPPLIIGITLVAVGTSLPELAVCLAAAFRKEADIAIGNLIGSGIFNLTAVLGTAAVIRPVPSTPMGGANPTDLLALCFLTLLCIPLLSSGSKITRSEGLILLTTYGVYLTIRLGFPG